MPSRRLDRVPASGASCTCTSQSGWRSVNRETARSSNGAVDTGTIIDLIKGEPVDWQQVVGSGVFTVLTGPVPRFGARGTATSIYVSDPDGNTIELRCYPADA
ncbi:hypothetical protein [Micromonospora marina]|uniref:hypothetical protein n=1 Tax=Micromonospora marina TaxID=307120 RepID=UPI003D736D7D